MPLVLHVGQNFTVTTRIMKQEKSICIGKYHPSNQVGLHPGTEAIIITEQYGC